MSDFLYYLVSSFKRRKKEKESKVNDHCFPKKTGNGKHILALQNFTQLNLTTRQHRFHNSCKLPTKYQYLGIFPCVL